MQVAAFARTAEIPCRLRLPVRDLVIPVISAAMCLLADERRESSGRCSAPRENCAQLTAISRT